jgi:hypothetical protein
MQVEWRLRRETQRCVSLVRLQFNAWTAGLWLARDSSDATTRLARSVITSATLVWHLQGPLRYQMANLAYVYVMACMDFVVPRSIAWPGSVCCCMTNVNLAVRAAWCMVKRTRDMDAYQSARPTWWMRAAKGRRDVHIWSDGAHQLKAGGQEEIRRH